uniref:Uncharacterized protein n=1 Tax=Graphocephala atropunctata TaxID=36148 RepID=A0A1B6L1K6_9HEMI
MYYIVHIYSFTVCVLVLYAIRRMLSVFRKKENRIKHLANGDENKNDENKSKVKISLNKNFEQIPHLLTLRTALLPERSTAVTKQKRDFQIQTSLGDVGREEVVSVFVRTSQQLQDMVRGYELKVNQTTDHIGCLREHIGLLHDQLAAKNNTIARMCDRYLTLAREKQSSEDHLQRRIDELNAIVEACTHNNTPKLQKLLVQQINLSRHLKYQNENLTQHIKKICRQNIG